MKKLLLITMTVALLMSVYMNSRFITAFRGIQDDLDGFPNCAEELKLRNIL